MSFLNLFIYFAIILIRSLAGKPQQLLLIDDSPYYVFVGLCIVVIVVSLIKIAASNENIECFREYFAVGYGAPDPSFLLKFLHGSGQKISHLEYH